MSWSDFIQYGERGGVLRDTRKVGSVWASGSAFPATPQCHASVQPPHSLLNVGQRDLHVITTELKV